MEAACVGAGIEPEGRKYSAHITLARLNRAPSSKVSTFLAANAMFKAPPFRVTDFILFSSFRVSLRNAFLPWAAACRGRNG